MKHIMLIAGEASGDHHAAKLVHDIKLQESNVQFSGMGGTAMQAAGVTLHVNLAGNSVMGIVEVIRHLNVFYRAYKQLQKKLREQKPDLLILVDLPSFNMRLAKYAKKLGIKVLYYISPQIWAWKRWRIHAIRQSVDMMAVILPFEVDLYRQANVAVHYVGHPLLETVKPRMCLTDAKKYFDLSPNKITIGLLPGSRLNELKYLMPVIVQAAQQLKQRYPTVQFIMPIASSLSEATVRSYLPTTAPDEKPLKIHMVQGHNYDAMQCCHVIITASGTATLEIALSNIPMVIIYKVAPLTALLAWLMIHTQYAGLCNLLAQKKIVPELLQQHANANNIVQEVSRYLDDANYYARTKQALLEVTETLAAVEKKASLAKLALTMSR